MCNTRKCYLHILSLQLLSMGNLYVPDIEYRYTVMPDERDVFVWEQTDKWEQCDQMCSGTSHHFRGVYIICDLQYCDFFFMCLVQVSRQGSTCASTKRPAKKLEVFATNRMHRVHKNNRATRIALPSKYDFLIFFF